MEGLEPEEHKLSQEDLDNIQKLFEENILLGNGIMVSLLRQHIRIIRGLTLAA